MPREDNMNSYNMGTFQFSGAEKSSLTADEYTLFVLAIDTSLSVEAFDKEMEKCVQTIIETLKDPRRCPRKDNLLIRVVLFNSKVKEYHGFRKPDDRDWETTRIRR